MKTIKHNVHTKGFSLVEVVLAIGVIALAVVALIGLFGPTMSSVKQVVDSNFATAAISRVNFYVQNELSFDEAFDRAAGGHHLIVYKYNPVGGNESSEIRVDDGNNAAGGRGYTYSADHGLGRVEGIPLLVTFYRIPPSGSGGLSYGYTTEEKQQSGYVPFTIQIFEFPETLLGKFPTRSDLSIEFDEDESRVTIGLNLPRIISYTTAKTR